jgi:hypothetical protein
MLVTVYSIMDLFILLSGDTDTLATLVPEQLELIGTVLTNIVKVPFQVFMKLFQAFENVLWLMWELIAWWVRLRLIFLELFFQWISDFI